MRKTLLDFLSGQVRVTETKELYSVIDLTGPPTRSGGTIQFGVVYEDRRIEYVGDACLNDRPASPEQARQYFETQRKRIVQAGIVLA